jgi:uncharacterized protein (TIGR02266 family)
MPSDDSAPEGVERRLHERIPAKVHVRFGETVAAQRAFRAYSLNLSVGGLCLKTDKRYEMGAGLEMLVEIGEQRFELRGTVAWLRPGAVGIRFDKISDEDHQRLEILVKSLQGPSP